MCASSDDPKKTSIESRLAEWLSTQGYPLEMRVAATFRNAGFTAFLSETYEDPETGTFREIDIVASEDADVAEATVRVTFVVECKSSREHPWILFFPTEDNRLHPSAQMLYTPASKLGRQLLIRARHRVSAAPPFADARRIAYGMTQAFTSAKDVTYTAAQGVAKAVWSRIKSSNEEAAEYPFLDVFVPVIVIEGRLFHCYTSIPNLKRCWKKQTRGKCFGVHAFAEKEISSFMLLPQTT